MSLQKVVYGFIPTSITGCALWLDAADSSTITGTSPVTQWRDKSVNNYSMTYTGSPTYRTTAALNNLGCVTFNGTTSFNSGTDTMYWSGFSISQPFTVFVFCKSNNCCPDAPIYLLPYSWEKLTFDCNLLYNSLFIE